jgi:hypothetical protein
MARTTIATFDVLPVDQRVSGGIHVNLTAAGSCDGYPSVNWENRQAYVSLSWCISQSTGESNAM